MRSLLVQYRDLLQDITWLSLASVAVKPIWFIFITVLCVRVLGIEAYGILTTALALVTLTFSFTGLGIGKYVVREVSRDRTQANVFFVTFGFAKLILVLLACLVTLVVLFVAGYDATVRYSVVFAAVYIACLGFMEYVRTYFRAFQVLLYESISVVLEKILLIGCGAAFLFITRNATGTLIGLSIGMVLTTALTTVFVSRRLISIDVTKIDISFIWDKLSDLSSFSIAAIFSFMYLRVDVVMVEALAGLNEAGSYGLIMRIVESLNIIPYILVNAALFPRLSRMYAKSQWDEYFKLITVSLCALLILCSLISAIISFYSHVIVDLIAPNIDVTHIYGALSVLCWVLPLATIGSLCSSILLSANNQRFVALMVGISLAVNIVLNYSLIPVFGIVGASWSTIASECLLITGLFVRYLQIKREIVYGM